MTRIPASALVLFYCGIAAAQDTTRIFDLPEITVTATRSVLNALDSPSPVDVIIVDETASIYGGHVGDYLRFTNSVFLQDLGGSSALKTVFLRGTAPQHLLVMVNGVRQNSFQNGLVDFSLIPLSDVKQIEIVRGGSSALYGADALGGVVNILTRSARPGFEMRAEGGAGSFGYRRWKIGGQGRSGVIGLMAGGTYEEGDDEFPFHGEAGGPSSKRVNADFRRTNVYVHGDTQIEEHSTVRVLSQAVRSVRGIPGSLSFPSSAARQADDDVNLGLELRNGSLHGIELALKTSYHYSLQTYRDPNPFFPIDATYRNGLVSINPELHLTAGSKGRFLLGAEWNEGSLKGSDFGGVIRRTQRSVYISNEWRFVHDRPMWDLISLYGMLRYDAISDVDDVLMPKVGINVRVLREGDVRLRASYGRSFRSPSFNDLYYVGFSNPGLRPEYSTGADVGILAEMRNAEAVHRFGMTYFDIRTRDRILFDLTTFLPVNIGKVVSTGVEATYSGTFLDGHVVVEFNYSLVNAVKRNQISASDPSFGKQLVFIPRHSGSTIVTFFLAPASISIMHAAVGRRFTTDDHQSILPEHHLTDLRAGYSAGLGTAVLTLGVEIRNVFNRSYQVFPDYPMPGKAFRIGIGVDY
ncbi:MAG: TonB-dependent receptor [Bacteroidota bacterium]